MFTCVCGRYVASIFSLIPQTPSTDLWYPVSSPCRNYWLSHRFPKTPANGQFFADAKGAIGFLQTTQIISGVLLCIYFMHIIIAAHGAYASTDKTKIVWIETELFFFFFFSSFFLLLLFFTQNGRTSIFACVRGRYVASTASLVPKLQVLVYDTLPPTTVIIGYILPPTTAITGYDTLPPTTAITGYDTLPPSTAIIGYDTLPPSTAIIGYNALPPSTAIIGYAIGHLRDVGNLRWIAVCHSARCTHSHELGARLRTFLFGQAFLQALANHAVLWQWIVCISASIR